MPSEIKKVSLVVNILLVGKYSQIKAFWQHKFSLNTLIISQLYLSKDYRSLSSLNLDCQSCLPLSMVPYHSVSAVSVLARIPYPFPVVGKIEQKLQQQKLTKENSTKVRLIEILGHSYVKREQSMSICSEKMWSSAQDEYAQSEDISQGQISKWLKNREEKKIQVCCWWLQKNSVQDSSFYPIVPKKRRRFVGEIQGTTKRRLEVLSKMVQENARKLVFEILILSKHQKVGSFVFWHGTGWLLEKKTQKGICTKRIN